MQAKNISFDLSKITKLRYLVPKQIYSIQLSLLTIGTYGDKQFRAQIINPLTLTLHRHRKLETHVVETIVVTSSHACVTETYSQIIVCISFFIGMGREMRVNHRSTLQILIIDAQQNLS